MDVEKARHDDTWTIPRRRDAMTRERLLRAALAVFAERGFAGSSVRRICQRARANPAAIKYYFGSKEGLYHEVLRSAGAAFDTAELRAIADDDATPEAMLHRMIRHQLLPVLRRNRIGRYLRLFAWEDLSPTQTFREFLAAEQVPVLSTAATIVRRLLPPDTSPEDVSITTVWLINQATPFVRGRDTLSGPPFDLRYDAAMIDRLAERLTHLALAGLGARRIGSTEH